MAVTKQTTIRQGDLIDIWWLDEVTSLSADETINLSMLYEDNDILVINKEAGIVVHPGAGNPNKTLVNALLAYNHSSFSTMIDEHNRPGIVHRLDKDTSGTMVVAKNKATRSQLISSFKSKIVKKTYLALVHGSPKKSSGTITSLIGRNPNNRKKMAVVDTNGKAAKTEYKLLDHGHNFSLMLINIHSGRTHQIRVHMAYLGTSLLGDSLYGRKKLDMVTVSRQMLHAWKLEFPHPKTNESSLFIAPIPTDFQESAQRIGINLGSVL